MITVRPVRPDSKNYYFFVNKNYSRFSIKYRNIYIFEHTNFFDLTKRFWGFKKKHLSPSRNCQVWHDLIKIHVPIVISNSSPQSPTSNANIKPFKQSLSIFSLQIYKQDVCQQIWTQINLKDTLWLPSIPSVLPVNKTFSRSQKGESPLVI